MKAKQTTRAYNKIINMIQENNGRHISNTTLSLEPKLIIERWVLGHTVILLELFYDRDGGMIGVEVYVPITPKNSIPATIESLKTYIIQPEEV